MFYKWIFIILWLQRLVSGFCPDFISQEKACTCYSYLDGAVIQCKGLNSTRAIDKLKTVQTEIRELSIEDASIIEVGPRAFRNLRVKSLILDNNRIRTIHPDAFRGLESSLVSLSIAHNKLTEIPTDALTGFPNLLVLNLQCNNIGNIEGSAFRNISQLIELNLSCNQICKLSGTAFDSIKETLQSLILDQNCFKEIPAEALRNFKNLIALHLQYNEITSIDKLQLMNLLSLLMIRLSGNKIKTIDKYGFNNVPNLRYLFLDSNQMTSVEPNTLQQFKYLEIVDLSYNNIGEITSGAFHGLDHLMQLNLEGNNIKDIAPAAFANTPLLLLLLGDNCLTAVNREMFQGIPFLRQLSLTNNNIKMIQPFSFGSLPTLHMLDLSKNSLQSLQPSAVTANLQATVLLQENPLVCTQGGFHIIQGAQPTLLLNEPNVICKTKSASVIENVCPKRKSIPAPPICCLPKPTGPKNVPKESTESPIKVPKISLPGISEFNIDSQVTTVKSVQTESVLTTASTDSEPVSTTTKNIRNSTLNMARFWRFTAPPRRELLFTVSQPLAPHTIDSAGLSVVPTGDGFESGALVVKSQEQTDESNTNEPKANFNGGDQQKGSARPGSGNGRKQSGTSFGSQPGHSNNGPPAAFAAPGQQNQNEFPAENNFQQNGFQQPPFWNEFPFSRPNAPNGNIPPNGPLQPQIRNQNNFDASPRPQQFQPRPFAPVEQPQQRFSQQFPNNPQNFQNPAGQGSFNGQPNLTPQIVLTRNQQFAQQQAFGIVNGPPNPNAVQQNGFQPPQVGFERDANGQQVRPQQNIPPPNANQPIGLNSQQGLGLPKQPFPAFPPAGPNSPSFQNPGTQNEFGSNPSRVVPQAPQQVQFTQQRLQPPLPQEEQQRPQPRPQQPQQQLPPQQQQLPPQQQQLPPQQQQQPQPQQQPQQQQQQQQSQQQQSQPQQPPPPPQPQRAPTFNPPPAEIIQAHPSQVNVPTVQPQLPSQAVPVPPLQTESRPQITETSSVPPVQSSGEVQPPVKSQSSVTLPTTAQSQPIPPPTPQPPEPSAKAVEPAQPPQLVPSNPPAVTVVTTFPPLPPSEAQSTPAPFQPNEQPIFPPSPAVPAAVPNAATQAQPLVETFTPATQPPQQPVAQSILPENIPQVPAQQTVAVPSAPAVPAGPTNGTRVLRQSSH